MNTNPVRLTESAVVKLPRFGLFALLFAYALPGLIGRDPWRTDDAIGFGVIWTMAQGGWHDWLLPNIAGAPFVDDGPLFYWLGAVFVRAFGDWWPAHEVARLAALGSMALAAASIWYGVYLLGRRDEAQPQQFAFGGQPDPRDYGRALADGALLVCAATLGLLLRAHETSAELPEFALLCVSVYALARSLDRQTQGAVAFGLSISGLLLVRGVSASLIPVTTLLALLFLTSEWRALRWYWYATMLVCVIAPISAWIALVLHAPDGGLYLRTWWRAQHFGWWFLAPATWVYYLRNLPWFAWPAWPLAAWAIWTWRGQQRVPQFALPTAGLIGAAVHLAVGEATSDTAMFSLIPPLVLLAAFALPALRRGTANLIDWFALMMFSVFAALIWFGWSVLMTGVPAQVAANAARAAPGFVAHFEWHHVAFAVVTTVVWAWLVRWRVFARPNVLWRSVVLSAAGVTLVWSLFMTLMLPYVDYLKTYRHVSAELRAIVPTGACMTPESLGEAQRASLAYFDGFTFGRSCDWRLRYQTHGRHEVQTADGRWELVWSGHRAGDRDEDFTLYRRRSAPPNEDAAAPLMPTDSAIDMAPPLSGP